MMGEQLKTPVWLVRAGGYGEDEAIAMDQGLAIIGFNDIPDLSTVATRDDIVSIVRRADVGAREARVQNRAAQLMAFCHTMKPGDIVAIPRKTARSVALGRLKGSYRYQEIEGAMRHTRAVEWTRPDVPKNDIAQDLLYSLGAFMTVCRIQRNDAEARFAALIAGAQDPGLAGTTSIPPSVGDEEATDAQETPRISRMAEEQILDFIEKNFAGHKLARLVDAILGAQGYSTRLSPPGPDGGVDILAGRGALGFDHPRLCVQVKSQTSTADVNVLRSLQGTMQTFGADQGLLVCWGGFTKPSLHEARQNFFRVRLWDASDLVAAIYETYERLSAEIQAELPLTRVWTLVLEDGEG
jgi:restriction system protein